MAVTLRLFGENKGIGRNWFDDCKPSLGKGDKSVAANYLTIRQITIIDCVKTRNRFIVKC